MKTLGNKITECRKSKNMTQEQLARRMNVSPQAVSKWENDISVPDISTLISLSDIFGVSIDWLVKQTYETYQQPEMEEKPFNKLVLRINITENGVKKADVKIPMPMVKFGLKLTTSVMKGHQEFENVNFEEIVNMVEAGVRGKLLEVNETDGENVEIYVE